MPEILRPLLVFIATYRNSRDYESGRATGESSSHVLAVQPPLWSVWACFLKLQICLKGKRSDGILMV